MAGGRLSKRIDECGGGGRRRGSSELRRQRDGGGGCARHANDVRVGRYDAFFCSRAHSYKNWRIVGEIGEPKQNVIGGCCRHLRDISAVSEDEIRVNGGARRWSRLIGDRPPRDEQRVRLWAEFHLNGGRRIGQANCKRANFGKCEREFAATMQKTKKFSRRKPRSRRHRRPLPRAPFVVVAAAAAAVAAAVAAAAAAAALSKATCGGTLLDAKST